jgi:putative oxygen-independent coproporphyrinogen III oxidase
MFNFTALPPLSLYVHIPWCVRKCPYCDFNSHPQRGELPEAQYIDALLTDLEHDLPLVWGRRVISIFIGGGTPSLFSPESIDRLLSGLRARLALMPNAEITLEANPGTVEQQKFAEFRQAGINRLSIGVQSFDSETLQRLGRIHDGSQAVKAAESAHLAGFDNFNLDLMFGLPEQSVELALDDIRQAVQLRPAHISFYQLTLEPNTLFYAQPPALPNEDAIWDIQTRCQEQLFNSGYFQYEVSAYAQNGRKCRHNINYWQYGDYLGIGAGAHGKITDGPQQHIVRLWKVKHPKDYLAKLAAQQHIGEHWQVSRNDAAFEFMMNALRLTDGFSTELFFAHTGQPITIVEKQLNKAAEQSLLVWDSTSVRLTKKGNNFLNNVLELFVTGNDEHKALPPSSAAYSDT